MINCVSLHFFNSTHVLSPPSPHAFPYSPNSWSECRRLWLELREISSAILGGQPPFSVEATNQAEQLLVGAWEERIKGVYVVVAVNYQNKPL